MLGLEIKVLFSENGVLAQYKKLVFRDINQFHDILKLSVQLDNVLKLSQYGSNLVGGYSKTDIWITWEDGDDYVIKNMELNEDYHNIIKHIVDYQVWKIKNYHGDNEQAQMRVEFNDWLVERFEVTLAEALEL